MTLWTPKTTVLFIDLSKALDTLCKRLSDTDLWDHAVSWSLNSVCGPSSSSLNINKGVPQGSALGSTLFTICNVDQNITDASLHLHASNRIVYCCVNTVAVVFECLHSKLFSHTCSILNWCVIATKQSVCFPSKGRFQQFSFLLHPPQSILWNLLKTATSELMKMFKSQTLSLRRCSHFVCCDLGINLQIFKCCHACGLLPADWVLWCALYWNPPVTHGVQRQAWDSRPQLRLVDYLCVVFCKCGSSCVFKPASLQTSDDSSERIFVLTWFTCWLTYGHTPWRPNKVVSSTNRPVHQLVQVQFLLTVRRQCEVRCLACSSLIGRIQVSVSFFPLRL